MKKKNTETVEKKIKRMLILFITLLVLSGITAFPLKTELNFLVDLLNSNQNPGMFYQWLSKVNDAINEITHLYPFLSYGTDWLAFSHIVIGIFFIGVYMDPVKNIFITKTGIIACLLVFPLAFIAGYARGIPIFWQLIDCSFGAFGIIPLLLIYKWTKQIIKTNHKNK